MSEMYSNEGFHSNSKLIDIEKKKRTHCLYLNYLLKQTNQCHFLLNISTYLTAIEISYIDDVVHIDFQINCLLSPWNRKSTLKEKCAHCLSFLFERDMVIEQIDQMKNHWWCVFKETQPVTIESYAFDCSSRKYYELNFIVVICFEIQWVDDHSKERRAREIEWRSLFSIGVQRSCQSLDAMEDLAFFSFNGFVILSAIYEQNSIWTFDSVNNLWSRRYWFSRMIAWEESFSSVDSLVRRFSNIFDWIHFILLHALNHLHSNTNIVVGGRLSSWLSFKSYFSSSLCIHFLVFIAMTIGQIIPNCSSYSSLHYSPHFYVWISLKTTNNDVLFYLHWIFMFHSIERISSSNDVPLIVLMYVYSKFNRTIFVSIVLSLWSKILT